MKVTIVLNVQRLIEVNVENYEAIKQKLLETKADCKEHIISAVVYDKDDNELYYED